MLITKLETALSRGSQAVHHEAEVEFEAVRIVELLNINTGPKSNLTDVERDAQIYAELEREAQIYVEPAEHIRWAEVELDKVER